jgi:intracellular septation protein
MSDTPKQQEEISPLLKMALELGPLVVFFFANSRAEWLAKTFPIFENLGGPLFVATACFMVAIVISLAASWILTKKLAVMPLVTAVVVVVFGALTLLLNDKTFIKMKPTIINSLFGVLLLGGLFFGKSLLSYVFDSAFKLDKEGWMKLTLRWGIFFLFLAVLNEVVWRGAIYYWGDIQAADDFWVNFKVWGMFPITLIFTMFQMRLIMRHSLDDKFKS